jgi:hypothetical protein
MIITGNPAGNVGWWSKHLTREDTNERAEVMEISGLLADDLPTALREMQAIGAQSRSHGNFMYQANINPLADEHLTPEQWREAVDTLEKNLGLEGHQRVVIEHEKEGRVHRHVIWNRVDIENLRVVDIGGNYYTHERTARQLEQRFELTPTPSVHGQERQEGRADRPPELWEQRAAERSGIDPKALKLEITELWRNADNGKAFVAALEERGYMLAKGDRRDFCIIDQAGDSHSLARRIEGAKAKDVRERMADIDRESLPTVAHAREMQRARQRQMQSAAIERDRVAAAKPKIEPTASPRPEVQKAAAQTITRPSGPAPMPGKQDAVQAAWREKRDDEVSRVTNAGVSKGRGGLSILGVAGGLGDFVTSLLAGGSSKPTQTPDQLEEIKARRRAHIALENICDSVERGEGLKPSDIQNLTPSHLENIARSGDDYIRNLVTQRERDRERERDHEREWER